MNAELRLLAALRRELHELECVAPDTYDVCDFVVPDEVVAEAIARTTQRIAALEAKEVAV